MAERYPGYDVLRKRHSPSWNEQTRRVIDARLKLDPDRHEFLTDAEWRTLRAICDRIVPQPTDRQQPVPVAAMIDEKLTNNDSDGYRDARLPTLRDAWRVGLQALDAEAQARYGSAFTQLSVAVQDTLLLAIQHGDVSDPAWCRLPPALFFTDRLLHDIVGTYYAHPAAWNEIGYGGPASPRGYVRLYYDRRDPWEAAEAKPGHEKEARRANAHVG